MQIEKKYYNPERHTVHKAPCVKQPYADLLTVAVYRDKRGDFHAEKSIEVRTRKTNYRGDLLICASAKPEIPGRMSGVVCGKVELYDIKRVEDFTEEDWRNTCIPEESRPRTGWGWLVRNPRRVVEMPIKGQLGIYDLVTPKDDIMEYPRFVALGKKEYLKIRLENERKKHKNYL